MNAQPLRAGLIAALLLVVAGCGFHLSGDGGDVFPKALSTLNVTMPGPIAYPPLLLAMRDALRAQPGVTLSADPRAPTLVLLGEQFSVDVLAIDASGLVTDYVVNYGASYKLVDGTGQAWVPPTTVKLQRQYPFNRLSVLAMEKEQDYLQTRMRKDAVNQIVRRLAHVQPPAPVRAAPVVSAPPAPGIPTTSP